MLIAIKEGMEGLAKFSPLHCFQFVSDRLNPTFGRIEKLQARALYPDGWVDRIHVKVVLT